MPIANINGVDLNYAVTGQGHAVIFIHGLHNSYQNWVNQISVLSPQYQTVALDCRGHGRSAAPSREEEYSIEIFAKDVYGLLKMLNIEKCCPVGHSLGGFIALQFALDHPEMLAGLVLVDTASGPIKRTPGVNDLRQTLGELARSQGMEAVFEYNIAHNPVMAQRFQANPERREAMRRRMMMMSVDGYIYASQAIGKWQHVTSRLAEIKVPTLIYRGEDDLRFAEAVQTLKKGISDSELVTVEGAEHSPHREKADVFNETLVQFLSRTRW